VKCEESTLKSTVWFNKGCNGNTLVARVERHTQGFEGVIVRDLLANIVLSEEAAPAESTITLISAYTNAHGILLIAGELLAARERGVTLRAVVDRDGLTREGLNALCRFFDEVIVIAFNGLIFHPKQFVVLQGDIGAPDRAIALEGSANLTGAGLSLNIEEVVITRYSRETEQDTVELEALVESVRRKSDPDAEVHGRPMGLASPDEPRNAVWIIKQGELVNEVNRDYVSEELQSEARKRGTRRRTRTGGDDSRRLSGRAPGRRTLPLPAGVSVSDFRSADEADDDGAEQNRQEVIVEVAQAVLEEVDAEINTGEVDEDRLDATVISLIGECEVTRVASLNAANEVVGADLVGVYKSLSRQDAELYHGSGAGPVTEISWPSSGRCLVGNLADGYGNALTLHVRTYDVLTGDIVETAEARIWRRTRGGAAIEDRINLDPEVWRGGHLRQGDIAVFVPVRPMAETTPLARSLSLDVDEAHLLMVVIPADHPLHTRFPIMPNGRGQGTLRTR
tara:strand:- start:2343 stop:3869 length:1527 start_codon:yes stop_codon:yes gene_type:complete